MMISRFSAGVLRQYPMIVSKHRHFFSRLPLSVPSSQGFTPSRNFSTSLQRTFTLDRVKNVACYLLLGNCIFFATVLAASEKEAPLPQVLNEKVVQTIHNPAHIPELQSADFRDRREGLLETWEILFRKGVVEVQGKKDNEILSYFEAVQGIVEYVLAAEMKDNVFNLKGIIYTPVPATPLCTRGVISHDLVDPSIERDPLSLIMMKARTTIVRDYLFKGADLYILYPKEGFSQRTAEQQKIYKQELERFHFNLFDYPLECQRMPAKLTGATYFFQDKEGRAYVFSIQKTQAKNPNEEGPCGLLFGPIEDPAIHRHLLVLTDFLQLHNVLL